MPQCISSVFLKGLESFKISEVLCPKHSDGKISFNCLQSLISENLFFFFLPLARESLLRMKHT